MIKLHAKPLIFSFILDLFVFFSYFFQWMPSLQGWEPYVVLGATLAVIVFLIVTHQLLSKKTRPRKTNGTKISSLNLQTSSKDE
jgi:Ca2+/Na+ antiporter